MMPKKVIKIIAIVLAALMLMSVIAVFLQVIAVDATALLSPPITGDNDLDYIIPIAVLAIAVIAVVACLVMPKLKKNDKAVEADSASEE